MPTDQELLRRIRKGDSDAVAELYTRYAPIVWRFVFAKMKGDSHAGQDVLSETFLAAMKSLNNGATPDNIAGWLTGIARNKTTDWYRKQTRDTDLDQEPIARASADGVVSDVLEALPEEERVFLEWKYLDRCTVREISERTGRTEKAVEAMLYRARNAFRELYERMLNEQSSDSL